MCYALSVGLGRQQVKNIGVTLVIALEDDSNKCQLLRGRGGC
jgi:hypothetical protein